jgi:signal transduction histidine kinase
MPFLDILKSALKVPPLRHGDWESLRRALLARSLCMLVPVIAVYAALVLSLGHPVLPAAAGLANAILVLLLLHLRPTWRRALTWYLGLALAGLLWLSTSLWQGPPPAPALVIAALLGVLGLMLDGAALGSALFASALGLILLSFLSQPPAEEAARYAVLLQGVLACMLFLPSLGWFHGLRAGQRDLIQASQALLRQRDERQMLTLAVFHELSHAQIRLARLAAGREALDWEAMMGEAAHVQERTLEIRRLRDTFEDQPEPPPAELEFKRGVIIVFLALCGGVALSLSAYRLLHGLPWLWRGLAFLGLSGAGAYALRGGRAVPRWLLWSPVLLVPALLSFDLAQAWGRRLPPGTSFIQLGILMAGFLLGWRSALALALGSLALLGGALLALDPEPLRQSAQFAAVQLLGACMMMAICLQGLLWQNAVVALQDERHRELALGMLQRRRLLGTLFHDAANPLMALLGLCEQGRSGMGQPGDEARARRLVSRLGELLRDSQAWLMAEDPGERPGLSAVALEPVLAGVADLFQERLSAKRLGLSLEVEAGLRATAQAAVLRDSVLGNLVSNAIKFSRPGSNLELEAHAQSGEAVIELRDRGPGLDPGLLAALERGQDLPSSAGTSGEAGLGLGLALAREHLQRMGGRLELAERAGGGTVARLWLKAA